MGRAMSIAALVVVLAVGVAGPSAARARREGVRWSAANAQALCLRDPRGHAWVRRAVREWNTSPWVDIDYRVGACPTWVRTIRIRTANYGPTGWEGHNVWWWNTNSYLLHVNIKFNTYYRNRWRPRAMACHEIGHALGLGHNTLPTSCMYHLPTAPLPLPQDFSELGAIYS